MKKIKPILATIVVMLSLIITSCSNENSYKKIENPEKLKQGYVKYVSEYTSGVINKNSQIKFILNEPVYDLYAEGKVLPTDLFEITPNIKGDLVLEDKYTVVFKPKNLLNSSTVYSGKLNLKKLVNAESEFAYFPFQVQTLKQFINLDYLQYKPYRDIDLTKNFIEATIKSVDYIADNNLAKIITADQDGRSLPVRFIRKSNTDVSIIVDSVFRSSASSSNVNLNLNTNIEGLDHKKTTKVDIPSIKYFKVNDVRTSFYPKRYIEIIFSSPLSKKQNINGLIGLFDSDNKPVKCSILEDGATVKIFPKVNKDEYTVKVYRGLKDVSNKRLKQIYAETLDFEQIIPNISIVGKGNILPNSEGLIFPFDAIGLKEVKVTIVRVFKNNMGQFLHGNNFSVSSSRSLRKVGRPIFNRLVPLNLKNNKDYKLKKRFYIDINKLIDVKEGEIYNVELSFNKSNLAFSCGEETDKEELSSIEENEAFWDGDAYYRNDISYKYDNNERDNPCHSYFYRYHSGNVILSRNLISSNYGIIAKQNEDGTYNIIVTDLRTTLPISNALVELYNYQSQVVLSSKTNKDGFAKFSTNKKGLYIKVTKQNNVGYLRLQNEGVLSYSMFDISGKNSPKGVKGFLYGERGVWRPGDSIHIFFVLEDKSRKLPNDYPVTFELYNPNSQLTSKKVVKSGLNGFYRFTTLTSPDAVTGNWLIGANVGGQSFTKNLKVEMVKPNRLKVELTSKNKIIKTGVGNVFNLSSKWLTGANAGKLKATVKVKLKPLKTIFKGYSNYTFDDPTKSFRSDEKEVFNGKLDTQGKKEFYYKPKKNKEVPGMLKARFTSYVYEKGGDYSLNTQDYLLSNYKTYAGLEINLDDDKYNMIYTDKNHTLNFVSLDADGKKANTNLSVKIFKLRYSWWWSSSNDNIANYIKNTDYIVRKSGNIKTVNGKASYKFKIPSKDWGRYYVQVTDTKSGHVSGKEIYIDWPNWNSRGNSNSDAATMLAFSTEKEKYKVGEEVKLIIPTAASGRALISLEKGGKVLKMFWAETKKGVSEITFKATNDMLPNIYANITYIQKHSQTSNDLPIRMYGATPVYIENPASHLFPEISAPEVIKSEDNYKIKVSEKNGKGMTYSLAIVDEGLLDLTNYKTPKLWDFFYQRESLRTKTWDMYDYVMGAFGSRLEKMLAVGGDSEAEKNSDKKANRFVPVVKVLGPFYLEKGKTDIHKLKMSNYIGSVKVMVVAGNNGAYGKDEIAVPVRKPVMVLATLPRVLGTDETCDLPITVFVMDERVKNVKVKIEANDKLTIVGSNSSIIKFKKNGEKMVYFKLQTASTTGIAKVTVTVEGNGYKAYQKIELDVRNPNPPISLSDKYMLTDKKLTLDLSPIGIEGTNEMSIEVSAMPSINIEERLNYLITYPHGCIEQTTSSVLPQLFLGEITNLSSKRTSAVEKNIKAGVNRLYKFQLNDGGMSYWIGGKYSNEWGTCYAGHFMFEAERLGYLLPPTFKEKWIAYQTSKANSWTSSTPNEMVQAYRLYTLALSGKPVIGAMNRLKELPLRVEAIEMLASAYAVIGQVEIAKQLVENKKADYVQASRSYYYYSYGSKARDKAVRLMTYSILKDQSHAMTILEKVAESLSSNKYMSTQTTAFSLMAVSKYITVFNPHNEINLNYKIDGMSGTINTTMPMFSIAVVDSDKNQKVEIENKNEGSLYVRVVRKGIPRVKNEIEFSENLFLRVKYTDTNGNTINVESLKQGTEFKAVVVVENTNNIDDINDVALTQIFPSGWEIVNNRLLGSINKNADQPDFIDVRDDRVYQYFNLRISQSKSFEVSLIAAYTGEYYMPGVVVGAMYDDNFKAGIKGMKVKVVQ